MVAPVPRVGHRPGWVDRPYSGGGGELVDEAVDAGRVGRAPSGQGAVVELPGQGHDRGRPGRDPRPRAASHRPGAAPSAGVSAGSSGTALSRDAVEHRIALYSTDALTITSSVITCAYNRYVLCLLTAGTATPRKLQDQL
jgi:hypothetical protein